MPLRVSVRRALALAPLFVCILAPATADAQRRSTPVRPAGTTPVNNEDPPPPVPPDVVSRGENGRVVVRAIKLTEPLRVDGRLDESVYRSVPPITDFVQSVPDQGNVSTEKTEAWVMFDGSNFYVAGRLHESVPPDRWTANELRRDTSQLRQNDIFGALIDTFHDRRNGYNFYTNPLGARADQIVTDEGNPNTDWNPVWEVHTGRFDGGWTVEMAIPFKSIRYHSGRDQVWGIQLRRSIRRKNEWTHLTPVPASAGGPGGIFRVSLAATLIGLDLPTASRNLEVKPYAIERVTTDRTRTPIVSNDQARDVGIDAKYGVTANLTADLTVNTDFAQVEVDEQQVNLTRFLLQFPEKRDFFLEGQGLFDFGRGGPNLGGSSGGASTSLTPQLFYSRRIGLNNGRAIPINVGERLTGKVGRFGIGLMNIQTRDELVSKTPTTDFSVARIKRDILRRSSVGVIVTNRSRSTLKPGEGNLAYGADASFAFFQNLSMGGYYARSDTPGLEHDNDSYQGRFDYAADRWGAQAQYLKVGDNFNPEVGFIRRHDFKRSFGSVRYSPRPHKWGIRQVTYQPSFEYIVNGAGQMETRNIGGRFNVERENSDQFTVEGGNDYELLVNAFTPSPGVTIPTGRYSFSDVTTSYAFGQQRRASGTASLQLGHFYDGTITAFGYSTGRVAVLKQWSVEPSASINHVELPEGTFTTTVLRARTDYGFSPLMFVGGLVQYSSSDRVFGTNLRFRWEYHPGSELFVVYTDERDTQAAGFPDLKNRAFVVKVNHLFRF